VLMGAERSASQRKKSVQRKQRSFHCPGGAGLTKENVEKAGRGEIPRCGKLKKAGNTQKKRRSNWAVDINDVRGMVADLEGPKKERRNKEKGARKGRS